MYYAFLTFLGLLLRFIFIPSPGFKADIAFWKGWGIAAVDKGILWLCINSNYNYPPGFAYVIYVLQKIYNIFADPYIIDQYWNDQNLLYLSLIKGFTIVSDLIIIFLIVKIAQKIGSKMGLLVALIYFLNPAAIMDGSWWGQIDQFGLMLFLIAVLLLLYEKYSIASAVFIISTMMKFQNILFIPLFYIYIYKKASFNQLYRSLAAGLAAFVIIAFPFFITKQSGALLKLLTQNADWFPHYSLNAFNIWWIASGNAGMQMSDKHLVWGIMSAKQIGLFAFIAAYFITFAGLFLAKTKDLNRIFFIACTFTVLSFFHLLTQSHDRYAYHVIGFIPILFMMYEGKARRDMFIFYIFFSAFFFLNLYFAMYFNYPDVVFWPWSKDLALGITGYVAIAQILVYIYFFLRFVTPMIWQNRLIMGAFFAVFTIFILSKNSSYFFKKPINLSNIKPISHAQDYYYPVYNMNLNSLFGPMSWNRLSVNYYYYDKGIGSHADSKIDYALGGRFSKFISDYGIDTSGDPSAQVYFVVEGDGKELYKSEVKGRFDSPGHMEVDIKGVKYLSLRIIRATDTNYGAHANWLAPQIVR